jgi:hypothetical protein
MPDHSPRQPLRGWGGLSPRYWAFALVLQRDRLVDAHKRLIEAPRESEERRAAFRRLHIEAHFLLIALRHLVMSLEVCADVLDDERIRSVREAFEARAPWLKHFRDVLEHLDEYTTGGGRLRRKGELDENAGPLLVFEPMRRPLETMVYLGDWKLRLVSAAEAGVRLGHDLAAAWEEQFGPEEPRIVWGRSQ